MAEVVIQATVLMDAVKRAKERLKPQPNQMGSEWSQNERTLNGLEEAAEIALKSPFSPLVSLSLEEIWLIQHFLTAG